MLSPQIQAAPVDDILLEQFRRHDQRDTLEREKLERAPEIVPDQITPPPADRVLPPEQTCFTIDVIRLEGIETLPTLAWMPRKIEPYRGSCIGHDGINVILKVLQRELLVRGWVTTRVYLPPQELASGVLRLVVVPGILRNIGFSESVKHGNWLTAFPARPGELLNLRDLEQGLEQMKRLSSQDVDIEIQPGEQPGESDVLIHRQRARPWRGFLSVDDSGAKATGDLQGTLGLTADDLLGINDVFNINFGRNVDHADYGDNNHGTNIHYSWPYGYWTFSLGASENRYRQTVQGSTQVFKSSGINRQYDLRLQRVVWRSQTTRTGVQLRFVKRALRGLIEDVEVPSQRRDLSILEPAILHRHYLGSAVVDAQLAYVYSSPWFGASPDLPGVDVPTNRYRLWTAEAMLNQPFQLAKHAAVYSLVLRGQMTNDLVYGTELFGMGNRYTVRGYDGEQTLAGERGWVARNDLSLAITADGPQPYLGLDYGEVSGPTSAFLPANHLSGVALGVRGSWGQWHYDASAAWPMNRPAGFPAPHYTTAFMLSLRF